VEEDQGEEAAGMSAELAMQTGAQFRNSLHMPQRKMEKSEIRPETFVIIDTHHTIQYDTHRQYSARHNLLHINVWQLTAAFGIVLRRSMWDGAVRIEAKLWQMR